MIAYISIRWYTIYADGRTDRQQKERQEKNTMTKEMYKRILHTTKSAEKLDGIVRVAMFDEEIKREDFKELLNEMNAIIMKERGR